MSDLDKWRSVGVMKRTPATSKEKVLDKDLQAYRRLRHSGLQPPRIDGSAQLESRGVDKMEIETGHLLNAEQRKSAREGMDRAREIRESLDG